MSTPFDTRYIAAEDRYEHMPYIRSGRSGLKLPAIALGLWHNFGGVDKVENSRAMLRRSPNRFVFGADLAAGLVLGLMDLFLELMDLVLGLMDLVLGLMPAPA